MTNCDRFVLPIPHSCAGSTSKMKESPMDYRDLCTQRVEVESTAAP